ncbi:hypothetical protein EDD22DRAFT_864951 [Suillus occidentalis]|nr:hypothetical protein EDD22DRAFT_864951 [Suillus occidentalis]
MFKLLQTFAFVFGLSDAIIGFTIFAVSDSLADLSKATISMVIMGFSTCFGVPIVNFFLAIGISGSYVFVQTRSELCTLYG